MPLILIIYRRYKFNGLEWDMELSNSRLSIYQLWRAVASISYKKRLRHILLLSDHRVLAGFNTCCIK